MPQFSPLELLMLALLVLNLAIGAMLLLRRKGSAQDKNAERIAEAIRDYFRRSGVEVSVGCASLDGGKNYTAFVESEPMKRFRLSHIIEATVSEHVQKTCKLELEKIYWRFPIKEGALLRAEPDENTTVASPAARPAVPAATPAGMPAAAKAAGMPAAAKAAAKAAETDDYINEGLTHYKHLPKVEAEEVSWETFQQMQGPGATKK